MSQALHLAQINALNGHARLPFLAGIAVGFAVIVTKWDTNHRTRHHLRELEPHLLNDIGLDQLTAQAEGAKPFWQD